MKPIIFNTQMVRANLAGKKTVTRRLVKTKGKGHQYSPISNKAGLIGEQDGIYLWEHDGVTYPIKAPYAPGDILYVRETCAELTIGHYLYRAFPGAGKEPEKQDEALAKLGLKWCPSIHMPKTAARIFLRIKAVRPEHLFDMSSDDALAEGIESDYEGTTIGVLDAFATLWDSTIMPKDLATSSWDANPWVWVIE